MLRKLKGPMTAVLLSSVALVPAATVAYVATADAAYAKSEKAGGKSGSAPGKNKSSTSKGKSGTKSASSRGGSKSRGGGGLGRLLDRVTGRDKAVARSSAKAIAKSDPMHPSNLGNMNGALNANENAILAHIRNGNTNGPVGLMAALAVADYQTADDRELLDSNLAAEYAALDDALATAGYESFQDYENAVIDDPDNFNQDIEDAYAGVGQADLNEALGDYASYEDYQAAVAGDELLFDQDIEDAYAALGYDQTTADSLDQAEENAAEYADAMDALIDYWNKGDADSENADDLRQALEDRVAGYEGVGETVDTLEGEAASSDACAEGEACEDGEEVAVAE